MTLSNNPELYKDEFEQDWKFAQDKGCHCCTSIPPCSFCVDGFCLSCDEYVSMRLSEHVEHEPRLVDILVSNYDRAMDGLFW